MENKNVNGYLVCPYDNNHQVLPFRLAPHLARCSQNYPDSAMIRCPVNINHVVKSDELKQHMEICENYKDYIRYQKANIFHPLEPQPLTKDLAKFEENWDDDPEMGTYNPQKHCENKLIIRKLSGASKTQKRAFRDAQRKKMREFNNK